LALILVQRVSAFWRIVWNVRVSRRLTSYLNSKRGFYVASVLLKRLVRLSGYRKKRWKFEDGWLILETF
jgi:hypothetical protein